MQNNFAGAAISAIKLKMKYKIIHVKRKSKKKYLKINKIQIINKRNLKV